VRAQTQASFWCVRFQVSVVRCSVLAGARAGGGRVLPAVETARRAAEAAAGQQQTRVKAAKFVDFSKFRANSCRPLAKHQVNDNTRSESCGKFALFTDGQTGQT
jgi:hypothetical protein